MAYYLQNPRMAWTEEEDQCLRAAVARYGVKRWAQIAALLPGRTSKACSHRWRTYLQPGVMHTSTNPFTEWEVAVVKEAHKVLGNNWSAIARMLPGRTNAAVKNFWYAHKRRSQRARGRGHTRQCTVSDPADPSAADPDGEADDEDLCDADLDPDLDFADVDDADVDLDFCDDGDLGCDDDDDACDEFCHDELAGDEHLLKGAVIHTSSYDMSGLPVGSWEPSADFTALTLDSTQPSQQQQQQQQSQQQLPQDYCGTNSREDCYSTQPYPSSSQALHSSPTVGVLGSTHASPTTPVVRTAECNNSDTPGHHSSSCNNSWSRQQQQQCRAYSAAGYMGSPVVPPNRESAAGAPPGTAGVSAFPRSPVVPSNGHSCAGAPSGTSSVPTFLGSPMVPPNGHSCAGAPPGTSSVANVLGSPVVPSTAHPTTLLDHQAHLHVRFSHGRISSDSLLMEAMADLECKDLDHADVARSTGVNADMALMRDHSGCLVDVHVPGVSASHSSLLDDHLLPFSSQPNHNTSNHQRGHTTSLLGASAAVIQPKVEPTIAAAPGGTGPQSHWGLRDIPDMPPLHLQAGQKRRISQLHMHPGSCEVVTTATRGQPSYGMRLGVDGYSDKDSSLWGGSMLPQQQLKVQYIYSSDGGGASSSSGHESTLSGHLHLPPLKQEPHFAGAFPADNASILQHQQQQQKLGVAEQPVDLQQGPKQQQQRPQHMAKRFCLDLSDEALAAERV